MNWKKLFGPWQTWLWALVWFALPALLTIGLWKPIFQRSPFLLFLVGVVMATLRAGRRAGILVAAGSAVVVYYLQQPLTTETALTSLLMLAATVLVSWMLDAAQRGTLAMRDRDVFEERMGDAVSDFVWSCDLKGHPFYLNRRHLEYIGLTLAQIEGNGWPQFIHPDDISILSQHFAEATRLTSRYECEVRYKAANGSYRWFLYRGAPIQNERNEIVKWVGTSTDIHKRKEAEFAVKNSQRQLMLALEYAKMGEWGWDRATKVVRFSTRAAEIFGVTPADSHDGTTMLEKLHEEDRGETMQKVRVSMDERRDYDAEFRVRRAPEGDFVWVSAKGRALYSEEGVAIGMSGIVQDITSRKAAEQEMERLLQSERRSRATAETANRMKDEFLATLSHELRTPLNAIAGWAQLLKTSSENPEEVLEAAEVIERNTRVQAKLVEDLLDMSRIISGKIRLDWQEVRLPGVISDALEMVSKAAEAKSLKITTTLEEILRPLHGDPARLQQVISNLLTNAIKFTPSGASIEIVVRNVDAQVEISVRDTGIGIKPEFLPHVFDRFRQAEAGTSRQHTGLGLGLSIVKNLVELHHGTITCQSDGAGKGSVFTVCLPLGAEDRSNDLPVPSPAFPRVLPPASSAEGGSGRRVLVVDDNQDAREIVRRVLQPSGAEIIMLEDAREALQLISRERFDLLVSDIGMPGMDGFELIRNIRSMESPARHVLAVALTAFARGEDRERALAEGFDYFYSKPVQGEDLLSIFSKVPGRKFWERVPLKVAPAEEEKTPPTS